MIEPDELSEVVATMEALIESQRALAACVAALTAALSDLTEPDAEAAGLRSRGHLTVRQARELVEQSQVVLSRRAAPGPPRQGLERQ